MVPIEAFVPYDKGDLLNDIHKVGMVEIMVSSIWLTNTIYLVSTSRNYYGFEILWLL